MSVAQKYVRSLKKMATSLASKCNIATSSNQPTTANQINDELDVGEEIEIDDLIEEPVETELIQQSAVDKFEEINLRKRIKSAAEIVAEPTNAYLKATTSAQEDDPVLHFFRSLIPDIKKLDSRKQRAFKTNVLQLLNRSLDEQEEGAESSSSRPITTRSEYNNFPTQNLSYSSGNPYIVRSYWDSHI